jgi:DNA repair exonuclease SbcCD ATPase subunit
MPIHLNPFKLYKNTVGINHGLLVEMLRDSQVFWVAYKDLLELNGKKESDVKELREIMHKMGLVPKDKRKAAQKVRLQALSNVEKNIEDSLKKLEAMFRSLRGIIQNDETFLYKTVAELERLHWKAGMIHNIPDYMIGSVQGHIRALINHMAVVQQHAWDVSKAHARGFTKIADITILSTRAERRRIRVHTLELDHLRNRIEPLMKHVEALEKIVPRDEVHKVYAEIVELVNLYREEITNLKEILHEADILIRRTERLFKALEHEAASLNLGYIRKRIKTYSSKFHSLLISVEKQSRREYFDIRHILNSIPLPKVPAHVPVIQKAA